MGALLCAASRRVSRTQEFILETKQLKLKRNGKYRMTIAGVILMRQTKKSCCEDGGKEKKTQ